MQDLLQTLQDHDLGHLRVIAEHWGIEIPSGTLLEVAKFIAEYLSTQEFISEIEDSLPGPTREVFQFIIKRGGRTAMSNLVRSFGEIREMGPGRRDREKPWRDPISPLEDLWYRGLCAKSFLDTPTGAQEFAFIPNEILNALSQSSGKQIQPTGHRASSPSVVIEAHTYAVDDTTTLLAYLRKSSPNSLKDWEHLPQRMENFFHRPESINLLLSLLIQLGIVSHSSFEPKPSATKAFLELSSVRILNQLFDAWINSTEWNDLSKLSGLSASNDEWPNDPIVSRQSILQVLTNIPTGVWWDLEGFISDIHSSVPSFQRPAGDFDSWYLFRTEGGEYLRGFENWDHVEGDLIRYILSCPLHWLGAVDIGMPPKSDRVVAIRLTPMSRPFLQAKHIVQEKDEDGPISLLPDGLIRASIESNRAMRYQIARFTDWVSFDGDEYIYRITPQSLQKASEQKLNLAHFQSILNMACENVPPAISEALIRWDAEGVEARIERTLILRVNDPETLKSLQTNPRTARYILETLSPTAAIIHHGSQTKLYKAAVQNGLFIDLARDE